MYIPPQLFAPRRHRVHRGLVTPQNDSETFPLGLVDQEDEVFAAFRGLRFRDGLLANLAGTTTGSGEREDLSNHGSHPLTAPGRYGSFRGRYVNRLSLGESRRRQGVSATAGQEHFCAASINNSDARRFVHSLLLSHTDLKLDDRKLVALWAKQAARDRIEGINDNDERERERGLADLSPNYARTERTGFETIRSDRESELHRRRDFTGFDVDKPGENTAHVRRQGTHLEKLPSSARDGQQPLWCDLGMIRDEY